MSFSAFDSHNDTWPARAIRERFVLRMNNGQCATGLDTPGGGGVAYKMDAVPGA